MPSRLLEGDTALVRVNAFAPGAIEVAAMAVDGGIALHNWIE